MISTRLLPCVCAWDCKRPRRQFRDCLSWLSGSRIICGGVTLKQNIHYYFKAGWGGSGLGLMNSAHNATRSRDEIFEKSIVNMWVYASTEPLYMSIDAYIRADTYIYDDVVLNIIFCRVEDAQTVDKAILC